MSSKSVLTKTSPGASDATSNLELVDGFTDYLASLTGANLVPFPLANH